MTVDSLQKLSFSFTDVDFLTEALAGWDTRFLPLERGDSSFQLTLLSTPMAMVSQVSVGTRVSQEGAPAEGFVTFGLVTDTCGEMKWNNYQLSQSSIFISPTSQEFRCVSPAGFQGTSIAIEKVKLAKIAERDCQFFD